MSSRDKIKFRIKIDQFWAREYATAETFDAALAVLARERALAAEVDDPTEEASECVQF
jgi:hypothetical protein